MKIYEEKTPSFIFRNEKQGWLVFDKPVKAISASKIEDVIPSLKEVDNLVNTGLWAAGYIAYEATPAFDDRADAYPSDDFPLLSFAFFNKPTIEKELINQNKKIDELFSLNWEPEVSEQEYKKVITKIKKYIEDGDIYQVNFTFRMRCTFEIDPFFYFVNIYNSHPVPYAAYANFGRYAICSFSPELFFSIEKNKIISQPMKGTSKRGKSIEDDEYFINLLKNSAKERAENVMIVDIMRNDIGKIAKTGTVKVPELFCVKKYLTVLQMISDVEGETTASFDEIVRALFPPASVTGAPKKRATQIIRELEKSPRHLYCGTIGWYSPKRKATFNVAIRSVLIDREKKTAEFGTGSGIVWDSNQDKEYSECFLKTNIIKAPFKETKILETILWTKEEGYFLLDLHIKRAAKSAEYFSYPFDKEKVLFILKEKIKDFYYNQHLLRFTIDRYGKIEIESIPLDLTINKEIELFPIVEPIDSRNIFLYHKTTNRFHYEKYKENIEGIPETCDLLFINEKREITETTIANIVAEINGEKYTPPVESGLLAGVFREYLLTNGIIKERILTLDDIKRATHIWRINSVRKWQECKLSFNK
ncbi:MAG: aminodeoxychorismate synthase component I [Chitinispirillaceae bacterium]|nr:aminodeoxychorismate synthase component I [Chitinispirillaceae bacterium]